MVDQDTFNKRPDFTHAWFNFVNGAKLVPEYAITGFRGFNHGATTRPCTVIAEKALLVYAQVLRDALNCMAIYKGAPISLAAFAALLAFKEGRRVGHFQRGSLLSMACLSVTSSMYLRSPPIGMPVAIRVIFTGYFARI